MKPPERDIDYTTGRVAYVTHWGINQLQERGHLVSNIRVGSYVTHSQRPAWGIGKVYGQSAQHVLVGFENLPEPERLKRLQWREGLLEKSAVKGGESLDAIKVECDSTCHPVGLITKKVAGPLVAEWTFDQAFERFIQKYPSGFKDAWYIPSQREWREAAHTGMGEGVPLHRRAAQVV